MKKILTALAALTLSVMCLAGCGGKELDMNAVSTGILNGVPFTEQLQETSEDIALKRLGIDTEDAESCIAYTSTNAVVDEFAVIKATNINNVTDAIQNHITAQAATYSSYAPAEVSKLNSAIVKTVGDYVIYVVSTDSAVADSVINSLAE